MSKPFAASPGDSPAPRRAAIYVRMSSSPQDHSIQQQCDHLSEYAQQHGIVMMYADAGKSGLRINGRDGLQGLMADVQAGAPGFELILVYDVSRWGRFQDVDESAHYEFICRRAGVQVIYCAEHFVNDGSPMYALMKGIKRIMAAEYSRELSAKVLQAQCRFSRMGYKQGGKPGYGLRRVPVSTNGSVGAPLKFGERKPAFTDRVALKHGPEDEVAVVRLIYQLYIDEGGTDNGIAARLQADGYRNDQGGVIDHSTVRRILTNRRYCGEILFNQTTRRMQTKVAMNPESIWVCCPDALEPMVSRAVFDAAQRIRAERAAGPAREDVLEQLRSVYRRHGTICEALCRAESVAGGLTIRRLFGGYVRAYAAAGIPPLHTHSGALGIRTMRILVEDMIGVVMEKAVIAGATICRTPVWNILELNGEVTVKVSVASCRYYPDEWRRWRVPVNSGAFAHFILCGLMDTDNKDISHYLLLAAADAPKRTIFLRTDKLERYATRCFSSLDDVFGLGRGE